MPEENDVERRSPHLGRRQLLVGGAAGAVVGAAAVGGTWFATSREDGGSEDGGSEDEESAEPAPPQPRRFQSTQLTAADAKAWRAEGATLAAGYLFTSPRSPDFRGVVYDDAAEPVWIEPSGNPCLDLRVQTYDGRPCLTYWTGKVLEGLGYGVGRILDENYRLVAEVSAGNGIQADFHEFQLTEAGTALITAYPVLPWDLSPIGGPTDGWIVGARIQEVDVATGEVLLDWEGMDHIDLTETVRELEEESGTRAKPFDPVHVNSVAEDGDGLLLSARHTSALYRIDRRTGEIRWRFGGKQTDIEVPEGGEFGWQHDLRRQPDGTLTIYDNHENAEETDAVSAALRFRVDEEAMTAELVDALRHEDRYGYAMGNAHYLADGHVLVGWGMDPYATEFDENGEVVFELSGLGLGSYRSWRYEWAGRPATTPDLAVVDGQAFMSWNGATDVARWRVLAGATPDDLAEVVVVDRTGFETAAPVASDTYPVVRVEALDADGAVLASSAPRRADALTSL